MKNTKMKIEKRNGANLQAMFQNIHRYAAFFTERGFAAFLGP